MLVETEREAGLKIYCYSCGCVAGKCREKGCSSGPSACRHCNEKSFLDKCGNHEGLPRLHDFRCVEYHA